MVIRRNLVVLTWLVAVEHSEGFGGFAHITFGEFDLAGVDGTLQIDGAQIELAPCRRIELEHRIRFAVIVRWYWNKLGDASVRK